MLTIQRDSIWFSKALVSVCSKLYDTGFARTQTPTLYSICNGLFRLWVCNAKKSPKVLLKFPQFKTLQSCSAKQKYCSNVKHITAVYLMITFRSRCTCLLFEQLKSSHSPSFTSPVVFGSPLQLLTAGQVPVDFLSTGHHSILAVICLQFHSALRSTSECHGFLGQSYNEKGKS